MSSGRKPLGGPLAPEQFDNSKVSAAGPDSNPLGVMRHSAVTLMMGTGFMEFISPEPMALGGLCRVGAGHTEILAIGTTEPGQGHFKRFITALEPLAGKVTFWSMMSESFGSALRQHGYSPVRLQDGEGKWHDCLTKTIWEDERHAELPGLQPAVGDGGTGAVAGGTQAAVGVG